MYARIFGGTGSRLSYKDKYSSFSGNGNSNNNNSGNNVFLADARPTEIIVSPHSLSIGSAITSEADSSKEKVPPGGESVLNIGSTSATSAITASKSVDPSQEKVPQGAQSARLGQKRLQDSDSGTETQAGKKTAAISGSILGGNGQSQTDDEDSRQDSSVRKDVLGTSVTSIGGHEIRALDSTSTGGHEIKALDSTSTGGHEIKALDSEVSLESKHR